MKNKNLESRFFNLEKSLGNIKSTRSFINNEIEKNDRTISSNDNSISLAQKSSEVIKLWLEDSLKNNIDSISSLVTSGLKTVFCDRDLEFKIYQEMKYNKVAIRFALKDGDAEGNPKNTNGGAASVIISLILRLFIMSKLNMCNLILLDESMADLNAEYIPAAASFMKQLSDLLGINILLVTHNEDYLKYAHTSYEGDKKVSFIMKKIKGRNDEE